MPSSSTKWYHLSTAEKKAPTSSGYAKRRYTRYIERRSGATQSRRSRGSSANFRSVSSSEARRRFPVNSSEARRRINSGTRRTAAVLFGLFGKSKTIKRPHSV
jgi:hypothetical protein